MQLCGERVHHRTYGDGTVTEQTETNVSVRFDVGYVEKKFLYPSAFGPFLRLLEPARQAEIDAQLQALREAHDAARRRREEEADALREQLRREQLEQKRAAARRKRTTTTNRRKKQKADQEGGTEE